MLSVVSEDRKAKYKEFCKNNPIPIFSQYWWLDAVCGEDNWDVILVKKGSIILASMPIYLKKKGCFNIIYMPQLTQNMGVFIKYEKEQLANIDKRISFEIEICKQIIEQLPKHSLFIQKFHYNVTNWLPFYWSGFKQTTNYTYVLEDIKEHDKIIANFNYSKRKNIKKAIKQSLRVVFDIDADTFYLHHRKSLAEKEQRISYSKSVFYNIVTKAKELNCGNVIGIKNSDDELLCCLFLIWDKNCSYALISSINNASRKSGASSFMFYEAIKYVSQYTDVFDFEGSMIESVEKSFRKFGAKQVPYFKITKINNPLLKVVYMFYNF